MADYYGAAVCAKGHVVSGLLRPGERGDPKCGRCGSETIVQCPRCEAALRGHVKGVPGGGLGLGDYCWSCGEPYPWRERQIADAKRLVELRSEIEDWDEATKQRLREITGEIAAGTANPDIVVATAEWLDQHAGPVAKKTLWEVVKAIGTQALESYVKLKLHIT
jgi:hypothetical protein